MKINLPLSTDSFVDLLLAEKTGLQNNFISAFIAHAASAVVFHSEALKDLQDDCPVILCYSKHSGTGICITKLYTLYMAAKLIC